MKFSISVRIGDGSINHNCRNYFTDNVDQTRTYKNIEYCNDKIEDVYHELFDDAVKKYNESNYKSRRIDDYYAKVRSSKKIKTFDEALIMIGNKQIIDANPEYEEIFKNILDEYYRGFCERNKNLRVFSAHLHMDESTPHLHIDFVPFTDNTKGTNLHLERRVSGKMAFADMGFVGEGKTNTGTLKWCLAEKKIVAEIMKEHGLEWNEYGTEKNKLTMIEYKKMMAERDLDKVTKDLEEKKKEMEEVTKKLIKDKEKDEFYEGRIKEIQNGLGYLKNFQDLCENDPGYKIPEPLALMSSRAYKKDLIEPWSKRITLYVSDLVTLYNSDKLLISNLKETMKNKERELEFYKGKYEEDNSYIKRLTDEQKALKKDKETLMTLKRCIGEDTARKLLENANSLGNTVMPVRRNKDTEMEI